MRKHQHSIWWLIILLIIATGFIGLGAAGKTSAASGVIEVNNVSDVIADDGYCTLREAITASNDDAPSGSQNGECVAGTVEDTILLPTGEYSLTILGAGENTNMSGDLDIRGRLTVEGNGNVAINANSIDRVIHVLPGGNLTLENINIRGGNGLSGPVDGQGDSGGGIFSEGSLSMENSIIELNQSGHGGGGTSNGGPGGEGGGIAHFGNGALTLNNVIIRNNKTGVGGDGQPYGGRGGDGGGVYISSTNSVAFQFTNVVIENNIADRGGQGGISPDTDLSGRSGRGGGIGIAPNTQVVIYQGIVRGNRITVGHDGDGGGLYNQGLLTLLESDVISNLAANGRNAIVEGPDGSGGGYGGGIYTSGFLTVANSVVATNRAGNGGQGYPMDGPGPGGHGGGIYQAAGVIFMSHSTVNENSAGEGGIGDFISYPGGDGGGLYVTGVATVTTTSISQNQAGASGGIDYSHSGWGGGIFVSGTGTVFLDRSLVNENSAGFLPAGFDQRSGSGGGVAVGGTFSASNSTFSGNFTNDAPGYGSTAGSGGGIALLSNASLLLHSTTIAYNAVGAADTNGVGGGLAILGTSSTQIVTNSIIANNVSPALAPDCYGSITGGGNLLIENVDNCTITGVTTGNIIGVDPNIELLADNGGSTATHALNDGSPARDAGTYTGTGGEDQRGYPRPIDLPEIPNTADGCDIGAFEVQGIEVNPNYIFVEEGQSAAYQVRLTRPPTDVVTITLSYDATDLALNPTSLVFETGTWTMPQTITVVAIDDTVIEGTELLTISHASMSNDPFYNSIAVGPVEVEVLDNESQPLPTPTPSPTLVPHTPTATIAPSVTFSATSTVVSSSTPTPNSGTATPIIIATASPSNDNNQLYLPLIQR